MLGRQARRQTLSTYLNARCDEKGDVMKGTAALIEIRLVV